MNKLFFLILILLAACTFGHGDANAAQVSVDSATVSMDTSGRYTIGLKNVGWTYSGTLGSQPTNVATRASADAIGAYQEIAFAWSSVGQSYTGSIRAYLSRPLILYTSAPDQATTGAPVPFPDFDTVPSGLYSFSYKSSAFAPPVFSLTHISTPWLFFDKNANAVILSPASHFFVASMLGDGAARVACGYTKILKAVPAGFSHQCLMAYGSGINNTWDNWGNGLTALQGKVRPDEDADGLLTYFGYWTDNGASYYYNYDPTLGYQGTLEALVAR